MKVTDFDYDLPEELIAQHPSDRRDDCRLMFLSPNMFIEEDGKRSDCSLWITPDGQIEGSASMVHIYQGEKFCEKDYYSPSEDGFKVFDTPFGKVGIVICFDRHIPESIRTCSLMGADLVIIPTANTKKEPLEMFEWEIRVQAMQNSVFIAMSVVQSGNTAVILSFILGFFSGAIYPNVLNFAMENAGNKSATATGLITAATGLGGAVITASFGFVAELFGIRTAFDVLSVLMIMFP